MRSEGAESFHAAWEGRIDLAAGAGGPRENSREGGPKVSYPGGGGLP